jgi:hypothetical protein
MPHMPPPEPTPMALTLTEVANRLRCSKAHVSHLIAGTVPGLPQLPHIPLGRRKVVLASSLQLWMSKAEEGLS